MELHMFHLEPLIKASLKLMHSKKILTDEEFENIKKSMAAGNQISDLVEALNKVSEENEI